MEPIKIDLAMINQAEIARRLGISQMYVSYILRGMRKSDKYLQQIKELIRESAGKVA